MKRSISIAFMASLVAFVQLAGAQVSGDYTKSSLPIITTPLTRSYPEWLTAGPKAILPIQQNESGEWIVTQSLGDISATTSGIDSGRIGNCVAVSGDLAEVFAAWAVGKPVIYVLEVFQWLGDSIGCFIVPDDGTPAYGPTVPTVDMEDTLQDDQ
jgi:hypothetical protein